MKMPSVSCRCLTYKRLEFLDEVVHYFLNQDYSGEKEMIILNDDPEVKIIFDHPEVKVFNWNFRFDNIIKKLNAGMELCKNKIIFPWADDDIYEPWAISVMAEKMHSKPFMTWQPYYKHRGHNINLIGRPEYPMYAISRKFWKEIRPIPEDKKGLYYVVKRAKELGIYECAVLSQKEIFYHWRPGLTIERYKNKFDLAKQPEIYHLDPYKKI